MKLFKLHPSAIDPVRTGLALGALIGLWHLSWSILVAFGWAQPFIDFVFWMHFLKPPYVVQPFNFATAANPFGGDALTRVRDWLDLCRVVELDSQALMTA
jgi:hypothetical protein